MGVKHISKIEIEEHVDIVLDDGGELSTSYPWGANHQFYPVLDSGCFQIVLQCEGVEVEVTVELTEDAARKMAKELLEYADG